MVRPLRGEGGRRVRSLPLRKKPVLKEFPKNVATKLIKIPDPNKRPGTGSTTLVPRHGNKVENQARNLNIDMLPFDRNRVILNHSSGKPVDLISVRLLKDYNLVE